MGRKAIFTGVASAIALSLVAADASAAVSVLGTAAVNECSAAALSGDATDESITICTQALREVASEDALAGTHVNRGVLMLRRKNFVAARADFDTALKIKPGYGEAVVNRGASLLAERRFAEALAEIDRGLALGPEEPEKAYYNRALANEGLDDMKAAYFDYMKALELAPNWEDPRRELARFNVEEVR